mmetsp:Transcript_20508/g.50996  ORF Transcript_20508/g.50996 Transcript_20508/m.50996 type:complete len:220 (-) Transcript_20508:2046-2705(-)
MKSKELKILRKRLANANKCEDLLRGIDNATSYSFVSDAEVSSEGDESPQSKELSIVFSHSDKIPEGRMKDFLVLFENNMGEMYRNSSWGLDMESKSAELRDKKARYLYAIDNAEKLAGFVHFRFEYDDDESPSCAVLYIFEIQIESAYRRCGLGKRLMGICENIAREQSMTKVVLTVFKTNDQAMTFYTKKLTYEVDELSPSKFGDSSADYEILSFKLM